MLFLIKRCISCFTNEATTIPINLKHESNISGIVFSNMPMFFVLNIIQCSKPRTCFNNLTYKMWHVYIARNITIIINTVSFWYVSCLMFNLQLVFETLFLNDNKTFFLPFSSQLYTDNLVETLHSF